jgi:GNAT superfamily N-acetyltransferase
MTHPAPAIDLRNVERFEEPAFTGLVDEVFGEVRRKALMQRLCPAPPGWPQVPAPPVHRVRIGAFAGERLVGWSHGWRDPGRQLYVANSAVLPGYRRQGLYTRLIAAVEAQALALGCDRVVSHHVADNSAVLIAKLKAGYVIAGTEFSDEMGLLVKLVHHLTEGRRALFASRIAPVDRACGSR